MSGNQQQILIKIGSCYRFKLLLLRERSSRDQPMQGEKSARVGGNCVKESIGYGSSSKQWQGSNL